MNFAGIFVVRKELITMYEPPIRRETWTDTLRVNKWPSEFWLSSALISARNMKKWPLSWVGTFTCTVALSCTRSGSSN